MRSDLMSSPRLAAVLALAISLLATRPGGAVILFNADAGCLLQGGGTSPGRQECRWTPTSTADGISKGSRLEFSFGQALCPAPDSTNYLCARTFGSAELLRAPGGGGPLTLRALASIARRNSTDTGLGSLAYASARIEVFNLGHSAVATPAAIAYFHFGLTGTARQSASIPGVELVSNAVATLTAGKQHALQCVGQCPPIRVNVANPGAPSPDSWDMSYLAVNLRVDVFVRGPNGVEYDAEAVAEFSDTITLNAIELRDANDQVIPGAHVFVTDANGAPVYDFPTEPPPPTTTTTLPGTTTTTSTTLPAVTTTTTPVSVTTTTTLPPGCVATATAESVACRLAELAAAVEAGDAGKLESRLLARLVAARAALERAGGTPRQAKKALRGALRGVNGYGKLLGSRKARRTIPEAIRTMLLAPVGGLRADLAAIRGATSPAS